MNTMRLTVLAAVALGLFASANGLGIPLMPSTTDLWTQYPASFPWENLKVLPENPPGADNELDVDNPDVGGYNAKATTYCNVFAFTPYGHPAGKGYCGYQFLYFAYQLFEMDQDYLSPWNCTSGNYIFQPPLKGFFGSSEVVCEPDKCCSQFVSNYFPSMDWPSMQEKWDTRYVKYYCNWLNEEIYCHLLFYQMGWCMYQYLTGGASDRHTMLACWDAFWTFYNTCATLKQVGAVAIAKGAKLEPDSYLDTVSPNVVNGITAIFWTPDRVCLPICHFKPEECNEEGSAPAPADGDAPADAPADGGSAPAPSTPASSDDSASGLTGAPVMLFAGMMSVFAFSRF